MALSKILLCLDSDAQPSVFDAVVATDAGVDQLFRHSNVRPEDVRDLTYGLMFTRGPKDLANSAIFIGGGDVTVGEALLKEATQSFFGPVRTSVMLDCNGCNTTAAAAVLAVRRHVPLQGSIATVLGGTGSVGRRVVQLLASEGARVRVGSRKLVHAEAACDKVLTPHPAAELEAKLVDSDETAAAAVDGAQIVVSSGAAGVEMLSDRVRRACSSLQAAIDLNAVPPSGIGGVDPQDKGVQRDGQICYGALGIGGSKMKIHKAAVQRLYRSNDQVLDAEEIYALGKEMES